MTAPRDDYNILKFSVRPTRPCDMTLCDAPLLQPMLALTCRGNLMDVRTTMTCIEQFMRAHEASPEVTSDLNLVLTEAMTNIARYAFPHEEGVIQCHLLLTDAFVKCCLHDQGIEFDPSEIPYNPPDPANIPEGGFGIFLMRSLTQNLTHRYENGINTLRFAMPKQACTL